MFNKGKLLINVILYTFLLYTLNRSLLKNKYKESTNIASRFLSMNNEIPNLKVVKC